MKTLRGPAIFLAQFMADEKPFDSIDAMAEWAANLGFKGVQVPTGNSAFIDVALAAESTTYCDELKGRVAAHGIEISELSTHLEGQLVAVHPAYNELFDGFAPAEVRGNPKARTAWAIEQVKLAAQASANLGLTEHATFSGALLWPMLYPWPQRPAGLVEEGFGELAKRWRPILDAFDAAGVDCCYEIHPGEDLHDGVTFERFLDAVDQLRRLRRGLLQLRLTTCNHSSASAPGPCSSSPPRRGTRSPPLRAPRSGNRWCWNSLPTSPAFLPKTSLFCPTGCALFEGASSRPCRGRRATVALDLGVPLLRRSRCLTCPQPPSVRQSRI